MFNASIIKLGIIVLLIISIFSIVLINTIYKSDVIERKPVTTVIIKSSPVVLFGASVKQAIKLYSPEKTIRQGLGFGISSSKKIKNKPLAIFGIFVSVGILVWNQRNEIKALYKENFN